MRGQIVLPFSSSSSINRALFLVNLFASYANLTVDLDSLEPQSGEENGLSSKFDFLRHVPYGVTHRSPPLSNSREIEITFNDDDQDDYNGVFVYSKEPGILKYLSTFRYPKRKRFISLHVRRGRRRLFGQQLQRPVARQINLPSSSPTTTAHSGTAAVSPHTTFTSSGQGTEKQLVITTPSTGTPGPSGITSKTAEISLPNVGTTPSLQHITTPTVTSIHGIATKVTNSVHPSSQTTAVVSQSSAAQPGTPTPIVSGQSTIHSIAQPGTPTAVVASQSTTHSSLETSAGGIATTSQHTELPIGTATPSSGITTRAATTADLRTVVSFNTSTLHFQTPPNTAQQPHVTEPGVTTHVVQTAPGSGAQVQTQPFSSSSSIPLQTQHPSSSGGTPMLVMTTPITGHPSTQIMTSIVTSSKSSTIRQFSPPSTPSQASPSFVVATLPSVNDAEKLENWPTSMDLISNIISTQLLGYVAGYVQVDKCAYELLEICTPSNGSSTCSLEECTSKCNLLANCRRITFDEDGLCRLETRSCQKQAPVGSSNSFIKVSNAYVQFPGNCQENFIMDYGLEGDQRAGCLRCTIEECRFACDMLPLCVGFSYFESPGTLESLNKQCYIKQDVCTQPVQGTHIFYQKLPLYA